MFSLVDHDEKRRKISDITISVIAQEGLEAATIRRIAQELGESTRSVTHYFAGKRDLLLSAFRVASEQFTEEWREALEADPTDLTGALLLMTPADEKAVRRLKLYLSLWEWAWRDPVAGAMLGRHIRTTADMAMDVLKARYGKHENLALMSRSLHVVVQGIAMQARVDPPAWPRERLRANIELQIHLLEASCLSITPTIPLPTEI